MAESSAPEKDYLLGISPTSLAIKGPTSSSIRLSPEGQHRLADFLRAGPASRGQVYLVLHHLRGNHDAIMLNVYVGWSSDTTQLPSMLAGSWAPYGLRTASLQHASNPGTGMNKSFNITPLLTSSPFISGSEISIRIEPGRPLPDSANLVLEHISLHYVEVN